MDFTTAYRILIDPQHEGGYSNNHADPGGETNMGITWPTLRLAIEQGVVPSSTTIKSLTSTQAADIYHRLYWTAAGCDAVPAVLRYDLFDTAVNSGIGRAIKFLQQAVGVTADGILGGRSIAAINAMDPYRVLCHFDGLRLDYINDLPTWPTFGRGWVQRIAANLQAA